MASKQQKKMNIDYPKADCKIMNYREIAKVLLGEHPQTIAIALTRIPAAEAGEILKLLPTFMQADLLTRISQIDELPEELVEEVDSLMADLFNRFG